MSPARKTSRGVPAMELVEETVHLLRRAPVGALAGYYAGTAPFALGLVFFWAWTTWFQPIDAAVTWAALGLVLLFAVMKVSHAEFATRLMALRIGIDPPTPSLTRWAKLAAAQMRLQPCGIFVLPVSLVLSVPFGWTYAYFQNASVIGDDESLGAEAATQARLWPAQNHLGLLLISALAVAVWLNIAVAFFTIPWLANRLLGIDNLFGFSGWWFANTTFLWSTIILTWLAVDPLVKAFYVLRVFYGRSRRSGEDLRVELRTAGRSRQAWRAATVALILAALLIPAASARAQQQPDKDSTEKSEAVKPAELDGAIDRVLEQNEFAWRLRPLPGAEISPEDEGMLKGLARTVVKWARDFGRWLQKIWRTVRNWMNSLFPKGHKVQEASAGPAIGHMVLQVLLWGATALVVGLLIAVIVMAVRRGRLSRRTTDMAKPVTVAAPDLRDERTQAAQLPADGWLALAHEQLAAGEWRLALRAVYLATLAQLAADGLVSLARFKTNLDYERELRRRALARQAVVLWFAARRGTFEDVWYGRATAAETTVREWLAEMERPQGS